MSASPLPVNPCPSCGEELPATAHFCPACGAPADGGAPLETPVVTRARRAALVRPARRVRPPLPRVRGRSARRSGSSRPATGPGESSRLFAAIAFFAALAEVTRGGRHAHWTERPSRFAVDGRAQAATAAQVWRTRLDATVNRWRTRSELDRLEAARGPLLQSLGAAVADGDAAAEAEARSRLRRARSRARAARGGARVPARRQRGEDSPRPPSGTGHDDGHSQRAQRPVPAARRGGSAAAGAGAGAIPAARRGHPATPSPDGDE